MGCSCPGNEDGILGPFRGRERACVYVCVACMYRMCVPVVVCTLHYDEWSVTSCAIVHRPPARSLDRSIVCAVYLCVTSPVLRFTNMHMYHFDFFA